MKRTPLKRKTSLRASEPLKPGAGLKAVAIRPSARRLRPGKSTPPPTVEDQARWDAMLRLGCLCCYLNRRKGLARACFARTRPELEIHHLTDAGRRISHDATVCLCRFHHQGDRLPYTGAGYKVQAERFGPSLGREKRHFQATYGSDADLLSLQNRLLAAAARAHG
jgi:hypothetical protein